MRTGTGTQGRVIRGHQNKGKYLDFILSARGNKVGFRKHSDQLPSIFILSFTRPIRAPKAELLGFCKTCLKGTAVKSGKQDEAVAYDQRVKSHEKKI